jgi:chromosome segregation ATPase
MASSIENVGVISQINTQQTISKLENRLLSLEIKHLSNASANSLQNTHNFSKLDGRITRLEKNVNHSVESINALVERIKILESQVADLQSLVQNKDDDPDTESNTDLNKAITRTFDNNDDDGLKADKNSSTIFTLISTLFILLSVVC